MDEKMSLHEEQKSASDIEREKELQQLLEEMKQRKRRKIKKCMVILPMIIIAVFGFRLVLKTINTEKVDSLAFIPAPKQVETSGSKTIRRLGLKARLEYVATYELTGRVVSVRNYFPFTEQDKISSTETGVAWDLLSDKEVDKAIVWQTPKRRELALAPVRENREFLQDLGVDEAMFGEMFSNNHLIAENFYITMLIRSIRKGDFVRIEGYLVDAKYGRTRWSTSTTRTDGASEMIYVTDVVWLKE